MDAVNMNRATVERRLREIAMATVPSLEEAFKELEQVKKKEQGTEEMHHV